MRLLLDTHVFIWVGDPDRERRIRDGVRRAIEDRANVVMVSAASAWEVAMKHHLGRLPGVAHLVHDWTAALQGLNAVEVPITGQHGLLAGRFEDANRDPFDCILAAQAIIEHAHLVTADRAMDGFGAELLW